MGSGARGTAVPVYLRNAGASSVRIGAASLRGFAASDFSLAAGGCGGTVLPRGGSCDLFVRPGQGPGRFLTAPGLGICPACYRGQPAFPGSCGGQRNQPADAAAPLSSRTALQPMVRPESGAAVFSSFCAEDRVTPVNRLGELERAIMDVLWDSTEPLTVRQVGLRLTNRDLAHTTVMTVLDRLAKKGFARRQRDGRAWRYQAAANREAYVTELMLHALDQTGDRSAALASFARRVSDSEAEVLRRALESIGELPRD
jgi:predicted transcriptional regulator